jgi:PAS domain S-box-containing protein
MRQIRRPLDADAVRGRPERCGRDLSAQFPHLIGTAIDAAMNGIVITDRQGVVEWVNPAFTRMTGYALPEIVGRTPRVLKSGLEPVAVYEDMWSTILAGRVWHGELRNRHKDGHVYTEEQTIAPVSNEAGEITHFVGIQQDITRRRMYEEMLETRNAELATLATTMGQITSSLQVEDVLSSIVGGVRELVPEALGATVQMADASGRLVTRAASAALGPRRSPMVFEPGSGAAGRAYRDREIVHVRDVADDPRYLRAETPPRYASLIALPIASADRVLGVLSVAGARKGAFLTHHEHLLTLVAGSAAIAVGHAAEYEARLTALQAAQRRLLEQQRLEQEIALAAEVQASLLPRRSPDLPGYDLAGMAFAARYVSGDLYDWLEVGPDRCHLALADIAGKGVPAALMTSTARALLREGAARGDSPGPALAHLNRSLYDDLTHAGFFITVVVAALDRRSAAVDYASAGHTEVLWYRAHDGACERLPATAPPIGVLPELAIQERRVHLCPGDVLVFYSDGVTEAEGDGGELFGTSRLVDLVRAGASLTAAALARSVVEAVDAFSHCARSDDLTIVVARALPRTVSFRVRADLDHLEQAMEVIRAVGQAYGTTFAYELELGSCEIITNVLEHAYRGVAGELRGEVRLEADRVQIDLHDDGRPFDLAALPAKDCRQASDRGYGVHITRNLMDEVTYAPATDAGNLWRLVKVRRREGAGDGS